MNLKNSIICHFIVLLYLVEETSTANMLEIVIEVEKDKEIKEDLESVYCCL